MARIGARAFNALSKLCATLRCDARRNANPGSGATAFISGVDHGNVNGNVIGRRRPNAAACMMLSCRSFGMPPLRSMSDTAVSPFFNSFIESAI